MTTSTKCSWRLKEPPRGHYVASSNYHPPKADMECGDKVASIAKQSSCAHSAQSVMAALRSFLYLFTNLISNLYYKYLLQISLINIFYKYNLKSILQISLTNLSYKSLLQISLSNLSFKSLLQISLTNLSYKYNKHCMTTSTLCSWLIVPKAQ